MKRRGEMGRNLGKKRRERGEIYEKERRKTEK